MAEYGRKYDRTTEIARRCAMIEGRFAELLDEAATDIVGLERRATLPPLDVSTNLLGSVTSVLSKIVRPQPAISGLDPRLSILLGDASSATTIRRYERIESAPLPTSILDGVGEYGGLDRAALYFAGCGYVGVMADWGMRSGRPFVQTIRPCDLEVDYDPGDPSVAIRHRWAHSRVIRGRTANLVMEWDLSDLDNPRLRVMRGREDITAELMGESLSGAAYPWRYSDGRPFFPIVVFGHPSRIWDLSNLASASLQAGVYRLCLAGIMVDSGYPHRNVANLTTGTSTMSDTRQASAALGPADIQVWRLSDDTRDSDHWQWDPGGDAEKTWNVIKEYESAATSQIGFPLVVTNTGGDPIESAVAAQEEAIMAQATAYRSGIAVLLRRLAAIANRAARSGLLPGWEQVSEDLPGVLLRDEIREALEEEQPEPKTEEPPTPAPPMMDDEDGGMKDDSNGDTE